MHGKQIRVIKRDERGRAATQADAPVKTPATTAERELKDVVSGWVREHQRRADEFRQNYSTLLGRLGFKSPHTTASAFNMMPAVQK